jgi:hypothetical protein
MPFTGQTNSPAVSDWKTTMKHQTQSLLVVQMSRGKVRGLPGAAGQLGPKDSALCRVSRKLPSSAANELPRALQTDTLRKCQ